MTLEQYDAEAKNCITGYFDGKLVELKEGSFFCVRLIPLRFEADLHHGLQTDGKEAFKQLCRQVYDLLAVKGKDLPKQHMQGNSPGHLLFKVQGNLGSTNLSKVASVQQMLAVESPDGGVLYAPDPSHEVQAMKLYHDIHDMSYAQRQYIAQESVLSLMDLSPRKCSSAAKLLPQAMHSCRMNGDGFSGHSTAHWQRVEPCL